MCATLGWVLAMDAQQFRFSSLAPWVERGLPWSLPRPFCLSPGFSLPVDPYRTGEFHLAVCVTPQIFVGSGATHTTPVFVSQGEVANLFFSYKILVLWAGYFTVHADKLGCECSVLFFPPGGFSFCDRRARVRTSQRRCGRARAQAASCGLTCVVRLLFSQGAGRRAVRKPRGRV